ncbi:hypothetical protein, partial [Persicitalea sp.]|uniref:hypothetical protein n=1 Tax=Persicitalea sp. TaxID=3100273 RepID=UPI003593F748
MKLNYNRFFLLVSMLLIGSVSVYGNNSTVLDTVRVEPFTRTLSQPIRQMILQANAQVPSAVLLAPDASQLAQFSTGNGGNPLVFSLPVSDKKSLDVYVEETSIISSSFEMITSSGKRITIPPRRAYRGTVLGEAGSTVSLTSTQDGLEGLILGKDFSYTLGKVGGDNPNQTHIIYRSDEYPEERVFNCEVEETLVLDTVRTPAKISGGRLAVNDCRKVEIYFEADYKLYQDWGSDISYITN